MTVFFIWKATRKLIKTMRQCFLLTSNKRVNMTDVLNEIRQSIDELTLQVSYLRDAVVSSNHNVAGAIKNTAPGAVDRFK